MTYTQKQKSALKELNLENKMLYLLDGGSRSGKSWLICKYIITKALTYPKSRHLICRLSKTSAYDTIYTQTLLEILENYDKNIWNEDKSHRYINFANGSQIRLGGFENKQHADAVLGSEYATIFVNEAIDLTYDIFDKLRSRLNWKDITLKMFLDCNPKAPSHWVSKFFLKQIDPKDNEKLDPEISDAIHRIRFHPLDNKENLSPVYLRQLEKLKGLSKKRFWDGEWAEDSEGIVYHAFDRRINVVDEPIKPIPEAETFTMWDFGVSDPCFVGIGQILQFADKRIQINIIDEYTNKNKSAEHYGKYLQTKPYYKYINRRDYGDPSGKNRDAQLKSWITELWKYGFQIQYTSSYSIDEMIDCANNIIPFVRVCEKQCPKIVEMFENWKYPLDTDGTKKVGSKPNHCIQSHPGTSVYYMACNRFGTKGAKLIV